MENDNSGLPPQASAYSALPLPAAPRHRMSPLAWVLTLSTAFFLIFLAASGAMFLRKSGSTSAKRGGAGIFSSGSIGVIELNGVILDSKKFLARLKRMEEDEEIKGVVLRINSPGGSVAPSQEIYEAIRMFKKPLVASMASTAASGGYYIACGAKKIYANPGTITGSIGVIMEFINLSKVYEWAKVKRYVIKTGKFKDAGAEFRDMTDEERGLLQAMVDDVLVQFKTAVSTGRHLSMEEVTKIADGRIFSGSQAKAAHLVDVLGTLQDAVNDVAKQAKLSGKPNVVYQDTSKRKWLDLILDTSDKEESGEAHEGLIGKFSGGIAGAFKKEFFGENSAAALTPGIYWLWSGH